MSTEDFSHTTAFLACLAPDEQHFTFQTFHDQRKEPGAIVHGTLQQHAAYLRSMQAQGHGVFWTVNRTNGTGREHTDITAVRCVWLDVDDAGRDITPICEALRPHCVVESSPGKHHIYWRVSDVALADAQPLLRALRIRWDGDAGAGGINRVMRLPGFQHLKSSTPHTTRITQWAPQMGPYQLTHITHYLLDGKHPDAFHEEAELDDTLQPEVEGWRNRISDEELLARLNGQIKSAPSAAEAFGGQSWTLHELWAPDMHDILARKLRNEARMALLTRLMYLTGGDSQRVFSLVQDHPLAVKDGRIRLLEKELAKARGSFLRWWEPEYAKRLAQQAETKAMAEGAGPGVSITPMVLSQEQMNADLVFVAKGQGVVIRSTKQVLKYADACAYFAGSRTEFADAETGKAKQVPTLPLWLMDPLNRKTVGLMTWRPSEPEICEPMDMIDGHSTAYNTWRGLKPAAAPEQWREWAAWFEHHVAYLVPIEAERRRFMQWLAHMVQKPGELPHTAYLMVTKTTGTGRNWLTSVLARAMSGYCALGVSLGPILDGKFNGVLSQKLLATVDEVREGLEGDRYARGEALKKLITEERRQIDHKYGMQVVEQNCCRWLILSNHESDALPFDNTDRRLNVIQNPEHRQSEDYYATLYGLLSQPAFIASVRRLLETISLEGFNAGAPAQMNDAKQRMVDSMTGVVDRAVAGFMNTWPDRVATLGDLMRHVQTVTGERTKPASLRYAMKRQGIEQLTDVVQIDGHDEVPIWWGEPITDPLPAIKAARARRAFVVVK